MSLFNPILVVNKTMMAKKNSWPMLSEPSEESNKYAVQEAQCLFQKEKQKHSVKIEQIVK